ncbi:MAG: damage-inducible protein DinB [Alphaproteobacteria bacterium]|nr:damage-inducible protein DinB [Alphaproteobacteria bacterium]
MLLDLPTAARYNAWANNRIYNALQGMSDADRRRDRRAFFGSIHNTMNHILLADLIYRERLEKKPTTYTSLDQILFEDFDALEEAHRTNDDWYAAFCEALDPAELENDLSFTAVGMDEDEYFSLPLRLCLTNLFQHQIHHRGQVHHMISHAEIDPPPVDVVKFGRGDIDEWTARPGGAA